MSNNHLPLSPVGCLPSQCVQVLLDILSPFLCQLFNRCLEHGIVPSSFKSGYVTPLLSKADLDAAELQSAYRANHLTETAMLMVMGDILLALDSGNLAMLSLLDLLAAFDTVDHDTLLRKLQTSYGFDGIVIKWFISYLSGRVQYVRTPITTSSRSPVVH